MRSKICWLGLKAASHAVKVGGALALMTALLWVAYIRSLRGGK